MGFGHKCAEGARRDGQGEATVDRQDAAKYNETYISESYTAVHVQGVENMEELLTYSQDTRRCFFWPVKRSESLDVLFQVEVVLSWPAAKKTRCCESLVKATEQSSLKDRIKELERDHLSEREESQKAFKKY